MNLYQPYTVYPATNTNRLTFARRGRSFMVDILKVQSIFHMIKISSIKLAGI